MVEPLYPLRCLLAQASQHLWLVNFDDVYREFTCVHHTIHPAPSPPDAGRDTVPSRFGCQSGDCGYRVRRLCTGRDLPAHLRRILLMEQQVWSIQLARQSTLRPRVAATTKCDGMWARQWRARRGAVRCLPAGSAWLTVSRPPVGFVDRAGAASEVRPVEACNSRSGRTALRHVHEPKAARVACLAVGHHIDRVHSTIRLEELTEVLIGRGARQVTNKNVHTKVLIGSVLSRSPEYA